ncbi:MAG: DUF898 domain-containing protein [Piscinibacter sp.]|nr:DUF898 domain-containing protein [Piscinibacter sp.]
MNLPAADPAPSTQPWRESEPEAPEHRLAIRFTGSGSEYFRIWIVNLLLTLVTLGLYLPWAKVRRLRYFYGNTQVGGHPLGFHANPWRMLRGYLLVALMLVLYSVAGHFSPTAGFAAFVIVAAIWPALLKASLQFRLANTSWRGLRFRFRGSVRDAYMALLPWFVPGGLIVGSLVAVPDQEHPPVWYGFLTLGVIGTLFCLVPWLWWKLKKYQHDHYAYGPEQTQLRTGPGSFYGVFAETLGIGAAGGTVVVLIAVVLVFGVTALGVFSGDAGSRPGKAVAFAIGLLGFLVAMLAMQLVPRPYFTARMQNLLWSRTASHSVGFESRLRFWPLFGLTLKNWLLMVLTLGLYWPFAAVAMQRMRMEAMQVVARIDPQTLVDAHGASEGDAAGDAAGDLFGLDIGL